MFLCAISGTTPTVPVVSSKSGNVYEKALIEKYIDQNGTDPITGEGLTRDDLIEVKAKPQTLPPRAPTQTSIPTLLTSLQSEFDAIMLESLDVKRSYQDARQELANALYREDAATRALARIMKERDEARTALASVQATIGIAEPAAEAPAAADADVDMSAAEKLPGPVESIIASTHASLSSTRKKRKPAPGYTTPAQIKSFTQQSTVPSLHATKPAGITALDVSADGKLAVTGGADKTVHVFDFESGKTLATLKGHTKPVKQVALVEKEGEARLAVSCSADKTVKVWSEGTDGAKWSLQHNLTGHKGEISGISVHPSQRFVAAGSTDETWSLYDLTSGETVKTYDPLAGQSGSFAYTSFAGHPDGILHGGGTQDGSIRIWDVRDASALAASLTSPTSSPTTTLSFSENGYYLASASATDPTVTIFDLRKLTVLSSWSLPAENKITEVRFDPSAQFLSVVGTDARVYANKSWDELCVFDDNAGDLTRARFVDLGRKLVLSGMDRTLRVLGASE